MNKLSIIYAGIVCLVGFMGYQPAPKKGLCPLKEGIIRPINPDSSVIGTMKATVQIVGQDSLVRSATDGRVREITPDLVHSGYSNVRVAIIRDTATYTYYGFDSCLVREGQLVKAGQVIGFAKTHKIYFFVSNYLYTHISVTPQNYVDCTCELPK